MSLAPLWVEVIVAALLVLSGLFVLISAIGFVRLPDFFLRMHPPALAYTFASLDEHDARCWIDRLARLLELTLLLEAGHGEYADRLKDRPLGMAPGARSF